MAKGIHTELTFESAIEISLLESGGYTQGFSEDFDSQLGLFPSYVTHFLKTSQPKAWEKLTNIPLTIKNSLFFEKKLLLLFLLYFCYFFLLSY